MAALFGALVLVPVNTIAGIMTGVLLIMKSRWRLLFAFIHSWRLHQQSLFEAAVQNLRYGFPPDLSTSSSCLFPGLALSRLQYVPRNLRTTR
jgi:hypothetical protein